MALLPRISTKIGCFTHPNGIEGIHASGVWHFHALGSYFEGVSSNTPSGHAGAESRLEGQHCASVNFRYGNGGGRTDRLVALRSVRNASVRSAYGWNDDGELIDVADCIDVDVHAARLAERFPGRT